MSERVPPGPFYREVTTACTLRSVSRSGDASGVGYISEIRH
jgi:hypothetical protein